jgi:hypothetical protein
MTALEAALDNPKASPSAIVSAATAILDRAFGRPAQSVDVNANVSAVIPQERARDIIARRLASIAERMGRSKRAASFSGSAGFVCVSRLHAALSVAAGVICCGRGRTWQ